MEFRKTIYFVTPVAYGASKVAPESAKRMTALRAMLPSPPHVYIGKGERHLASARLLGFKKVDKLLDLLGEESRIVCDGNGGFIQILANGTQVPSSKLDLSRKVPQIEEMIREMPDQSVAIGDFYIPKLLVGVNPEGGFPPASLYRLRSYRYSFLGLGFQPIALNGVPRPKQ